MSRLLSDLAPTAVVHVGLHKTGTTAFQEALDRTSSALLQVGVRVMQNQSGFYADTPMSMAFDLANAVIRIDSDAYFRIHQPQAILTSVRTQNERIVRRYAASPEPLLIASVEGLSLVSCLDEVHRLVELLAPREVHVLVALRERRAFLNSLRLQVERLGLRRTTVYRDSCLYLEDDSWIADFDRLIGLFGQVLGADRVHVVDYEEAVARHGSVVPALWAAAGLPNLEDLASVFGQPWVNLTPPPESSTADLMNVDDISDIAQLRSIARSASQEVAALKNSRSWRITSMFRQLVAYRRSIFAMRRT